MNTTIENFNFDEQAQLITVVMREESNTMYASNPPQRVPDKVWKDVYGIKDGRLSFIKKIEGRHLPPSIIPEKFIFG